MKPQTPYMLVAPLLLLGGAVSFSYGIWLLGILSVLLGLGTFFLARRAMIRGQVDEVLRNDDDSLKDSD